MHIGEQIINPTPDRLRLSRQLGCEHVVIDTRPSYDLMGDDGAWRAPLVAEFIAGIERHGVTVEALALDMGSILLDSLYNRERADATAQVIRKNIVAAADAGVRLLKYNVQMVGITRTGFKEGRGGVRCSTFRAAEYDPMKDAQFSYWGVGHPGGGIEGADIRVNAADSPEACGQVLASTVPGVSEQQGWDALEYLVEAIVPTAETAGIRLACHPHDPAFPKGGLNGVNHNLGSIEGLRRFLDLAPEARSHGLNFCQGTIAEMSSEPTPYVLRAIQEFGGRDRIYLVHFRNIQGGYLDFAECFPDEGSVDMAACVRAYNAVGYEGVLCPDHVPASDLDPARERFFAFALGYIRGLLQATGPT